MRVQAILAAAVIAGLLMFGCSGSTGPSKQPAISDGSIAIVSIDTTSALPGTTAKVHLRLDRTDPNTHELDSLGGFEFLIAYDSRALSFMQPARLGSTLSQWEYFTYRTGPSGLTDSSYLSAVRLIAYRNLDNNVLPNPPQFKPEESLITLSFRVTDNHKYVGTTPAIGFYVSGCRENVIFPERDHNHLYCPDTSLSEIVSTIGYDTTSCPHLTYSPLLEFRGGSIRIVAPEDDRPRRGDMDLDGTPNRIADAVLFTRYFHEGYSVFDATVAALQIANSDYDGDLEPLSISDLDSLIRIITAGDQGYTPDGLSIPYQDTLWIMPRRTDANTWILACRSTIQIDEMWMRIESPIDPRSVRYLSDSTVTVSLQSGLQVDSPPAVYTWFVSCGTTGPQTIFGPESGDRLEIRTANGELNIRSAQASRYPGVSMRVIVIHPR
ncbi:MAG: hypothetical protein HZB43_11880 [candidate division Zixibacteria bacterium]|nr:hypothetical protein [candidate division Zixibacteria bacterium]